MSIQINNNFDYKGNQPNFERDQFETLELMRSADKRSLDNGHISYCEETGKHYVFNENNDIDVETGKWRLLIENPEDLKSVLDLKADKSELDTKVDKVEGKSLISDTEIARLATINNYDDTQVNNDIADLDTNKQDKTDNALDTTDKTVVGAINEINGNTLDNVAFSSDYKNIIINRKSGLNPYTIPISSIIHNAKIIELNDVDSANIGDGKTLVYDGATQKHKYVDSTGTDELVKMDSTTDAKYLNELIDKSTIVNDNGVLKVKQLDGQQVTIAEINHLKGLTMNIMDLVNTFANGEVKIINTPVSTYADLLAYDKTGLIDGISYIVYVLVDETHDNAKTTYLIDKTSSTPTYFGFAGEHRDFTTNPIDLANEVTGKLGTSNIDVDALWSLLTINDTYKTLTAKDEVFGTHGAKALYDELVAEIGNKANATDLTTHTSDTDIHITTAERDKWNSYNATINEMKTNFQDGVNTIYDSVVARGVTPTDKSPSEIADAISKLGVDLTSIYNALTNKGLNMSGTENEDQISAIITDLMTIKSFTTQTDSITFVFNGNKDTIKDTELVDTSSGLKLEFSSKELTSVESGGYIEFAEINKAEYNNRLKFV